MRLQFHAPVMLTAALVFWTTGAAAFDNAKVLPKGVRSVNIRSINTDINETTDARGGKLVLADPLFKDLTFAKIAKDETPLKAEQLRAFLASNGLAEGDAVGQFTADLQGHISVIAPIASYGVSDKLTLAVALPIYSAQTSIVMGFRPNETANTFLTALARPENNQTAAARDAADKLNNAVARLNTKLVDNGYRELENWEGQGVGDLTLAAKYRFLSLADLSGATTLGVIAPTGQVDDQDVLNDIAFGDGQWDVFAQLSTDEEIAHHLVLNQFGKYTVQLPGAKNVRAVSADEQIEVNYDATRFKLGDKLDAGTSVTWEPQFGLITGVGYTYFRKFADLYRDINPDTKFELEDGSDQVAHNAEAVLGYSTVALYQAGVVPVPLELKLSYTRQLYSQNMPVSDLAQIDFSLFF